jgi:hypothetical protein
MRYTVSLDLALPLDQVVRLLADPAHLPSWLRGLVLHEPLSGAHGQVGTVSRVVLQTGKQRMEGTETVTRRESRDGVVHYERELVADGMWSAARERLIQAGPASTRWESENEYRFSGGPMRLAAPLLRPVFRRQSLQHMRDFQAFAERGEDVRS